MLCNMLCSFKLLVIGGPPTCCMWTSSNKIGWVVIRDESCSFSYQDGSCLISTSSLFLNNKQYGKGEMSQVVVYAYVFAFNFYLLFILWKYVEHDKPLLHLWIPCLFPLSLILCTLFHFLNFCYFRLKSPKG